MSLYSGDKLLAGKSMPASSLPLANGVASVGTSNYYARADHVHPKEISDESKELYDSAVFHTAHSTSWPTRDARPTNLIAAGSKFLTRDEEKDVLYCSEDCSASSSFPSRRTNMIAA